MLDTSRKRLIPCDIIFFQKLKWSEFTSSPAGRWSLPQLSILVLFASRAFQHHQRPLSYSTFPSFDLFSHILLSSVRLPPPNNVRSRYQHSNNPQHPISVRLRSNLVLRHSILLLLLLLPERPECTLSERRLPRNRKRGEAKGATRKGGNGSSYVPTAE